eukprot:PhF_6_TR41358/c0_g2_i4/m.62834
MLRKACIILISLFVPDHQMQVYVAMWVMTFNLILNHRVVPYDTKLLSRLEMASLSVIVVSLNVSLVFRRLPSDSVGYWIAGIGVLVVNVLVLALFVLCLCKGLLEVLRRYLEENPDVLAKHQWLGWWVGCTLPTKESLSVSNENDADDDGDSKLIGDQEKKKKKKSAANNEVESHHIGRRRNVSPGVLDTVLVKIGFVNRDTVDDQQHDIDRSITTEDDDIDDVKPRRGGQVGFQLGALLEHGENVDNVDTVSDEKQRRGGAIELSRASSLFTANNDYARLLELERTHHADTLRRAKLELETEREGVAAAKEALVMSQDNLANAKSKRDFVKGSLMEQVRNDPALVRKFAER